MSATEGSLKAGTGRAGVEAWVQYLFAGNAAFTKNRNKLETQLDRYLAQWLELSPGDDVFNMTRETAAGREILICSDDEQEGYAWLALCRAVDEPSDREPLGRFGVLPAACYVDLFTSLSDSQKPTKGNSLAAWVALAAVTNPKGIKISDSKGPGRVSLLDAYFELAPLVLHLSRNATFQGGLSAEVLESLKFWASINREPQTYETPFEQKIIKEIERLIRHPCDDLGVPKGDGEVEGMLDGFVSEIKDRQGDSIYKLVLKVRELDCGKRILARKPAERLDFVIPVQRRITLGALTRQELRGPETWEELMAELLKSLLQSKAPLPENLVNDLLKLLARAPGKAPLNSLLGRIETFNRETGLTPGHKKHLQDLFAGLGGQDLESDQWMYAEDRKLLERLKALFEGPRTSPSVVSSAWGKRLLADLADLNPKAQDAWEALLAHCKSAAGKSRPPAKWQGTAKELVDAVGEGELAGRLVPWLAALDPDPGKPEPNTELVKGLLWAAGSCSGAIGPEIGAFVERCFKKVPGLGARSAKLGNAGIFVLGQLEGDSGLAELTRLSGRIKYPSARAILENTLGAAAEARGQSLEDLAETTLPDYGLDRNGRYEESVGTYGAEIALRGSRFELLWRNRAGKTLKGAPAAAKKDHGPSVKSLRQVTKEINESFAAQAKRLESGYISGRSWPFDAWQQRFLHHRLMAQLSQRLIWVFERGAASQAYLPYGEEFLDHRGNPAEAPPADSEVKLWHPLCGTAEEVVAWRSLLRGREILQPFKQAYREIYLLTEAEAQTETYSNRFAAHILKQHQFHALCRERGWGYDLQGQWDSHNTPTRICEPLDLQVRFQVEAAEFAEASEYGIYLYVTSGQTSLWDLSGNPLRLADLPPLVFSELLRDIDLFVSVSSVGNDPQWIDGGVSPAGEAYWRSFSFGQLNETAKTRKAVLADLLPKLKIGGQCRLEGQFLVVQGKRRGYKIHLGSSNILMEPNDAYLCILAGSRPHRSAARVFLPFEGDSTLAIILSKAFLLAEDDKITDQTILSQIGPFD